MTRGPDEARGAARGTNAPTSPSGTPPSGTPPIPEQSLGRFPGEEHDTLRRGELAFPKEADTLTSHEGAPVARRRDTVPVPPMARPCAEATAGAETVDEDEEVLDEELLVDDDDTQTQVERRFRVSDDQTSPTLSLANQSRAAREVYRMFLASEYAPALELANELIAQGIDDSMLLTIARECRSSLAALASSAPPRFPVLDDGAERPRAMPFAALEPRVALRPPSPPVRGQRGSFATFDASTTIGEVASTMGLSVEQILGLLERFVGALPARPPR